MKDQSGPAFPTDISPSQSYTDIKGGMNKREYFAGQAMAELVGYASPEDVARKAVEYADALLAELRRE